MLCCFPKPIAPLIKKVCTVSPPPVPKPHSALFFILSEAENLASSSLQDEASDWLFCVRYLAPVELSF